MHREVGRAKDLSAPRYSAIVAQVHKNYQIILYNPDVSIAAVEL